MLGASNATRFLAFVAHRTSLPPPAPSSVAESQPSNATLQGLREAYRNGKLLLASAEALDLFRAASKPAGAPPPTSFPSLLRGYAARLSAVHGDRRLRRRRGGLRGWLVERHPPAAGLRALLRSGSPAALPALRSLLGWFRAELPYFRSPCPGCGEPSSFLGYAHPSAAEASADPTARRAELYLCEACEHAVWRFPRYNLPGAIVEAGRGRCGE
jgi:hypothetical protein